MAFHQTSDRFYPGINNIKPSRFFGLLNLLKKLDLNLWSESNCNFQADEKLKKTVVLTFDDGYKENIEILLRLCEDRITPIVFVPTDYIGQTNSWDYSSTFFPAEHLDLQDIKKLSEAGVIFGSHGLSHRALTTLTLERIKEELKRSKKTLEEITGREVNLFSYPFGRTTVQIDLLAQEVGYRHGMVLSTRRDSDGRVHEAGNDFRLVRRAIYSIDNYYSIKNKIQSDTGRERFKSSIINNLAGGTIFSSTSLK